MIVSTFLLCSSICSADTQVKKPNIVLIMADDMGYSDIGSYGGEIDTPNIDKIAEQGVRFSQFYNTSRCSPTRAALLTGLYPHKVQMGHLAGKRFNNIDGYRGNLDQSVRILPEVLGQYGYKNYMVGKWHLANYGADDLRQESISTLDNTPTKRGFNQFYGTLLGGNNYFSPKYLFQNDTAIASEGINYYYTEAISERAGSFIEAHLERDKEPPFFLYVAYTAPHSPIQAPAETIKKYRDRYRQGWDAIRQRRFEKMVEQGLIKPELSMSARDETVPPWQDVENTTWEAERMAVYAAMIDEMDQGIGVILSTLRRRGVLDNTLVIFLSDNGASDEGVPTADTPHYSDLPYWQSFLKSFYDKYEPSSGQSMLKGNDPQVLPGGKAVFQTIGAEWAHVSNTPFRKYKSWVYEGGIASPLLIRWSQGISVAVGSIIHEPGHVVDIMATVLEAAGIDEIIDDESSINLDGVSLMPNLNGKNPSRGPIYFEHEGNRAVRSGKWKIVSPKNGDWELYDMESDRAETRNLVSHYPDQVAKMRILYEDYARRSRVLPWRRLVESGGGEF